MTGILNLPACEIDGEFEQIINSGFENTLGWTFSGDIRDNSEYHGGSYSLRLVNGAPYYLNYVYQDFITPIPVSDITAFTFWAKEAATGGIRVHITYSDASTQNIDTSVTGTWAEYDITASLTAGKSISQIYITGLTSGSNYSYLDDISIIGGSLNNNIILAINIHLGCTNEVSSFDIMLDRGNVDYPYTFLATGTGTDIEIYLGRGSNKPLLLTGQIDEIEYIDEVVDFSFRNVCMIRGRCNGYQLFDRYWDGDLIATVGTAYRNYTRTSGDASSMVAYLIDKYTSLSHLRVSDNIASDATIAQKDITVDDGSLFSENQLVKIEDDYNWEYNRIDSIAGNVLTMYNNLICEYTTANNGKVWIDLIEKTGESDAQVPTTFTELLYINTIVFDIIKYIAEVVDLDGVIGYDTRIEYDGKFAFFSKGSKSESYTLQDECQLNRYLKDANRIKNKVWVYGKEDKPYPKDVDGQIYGDSWTDLATPSNLAWLTVNANSGQKDITLDTDQGAQFSEGDIIWIIDRETLNKGEQLTVDSVAGDVITCTTNLVNSYTTANQAVIFELFTNGGWGFYPLDADGVSIISENTIVYVGTYSVEFQVTAAITSALPLFAFRSGTTVDMDDYKHVKVMLYFQTNKPDYISLRLYSDETVNGYAKSNPIAINEVDEWVEIDVEGGTNSADNWEVGSTFDWNAVKRVGIFVYRTAGGTWTFYIDRLHFFGKRWGGGSDNATVDGYAENTSSIDTYGIRELKITSDLLLSDAECEAKAQALIDFYSSERLVIEVSTENLDWTTYNPMAGNKVAADLDVLGVTGITYRIDSIDIAFRSSDNSLSLVFTLDDTPMKLADYLYKLSERLRNLERNYEKIR